VLAALVGAAALIVGAMSPSAHGKQNGKKRAKITEIIVHATGGPSCSHGKVVFSPPGTLQLMRRFFKNSRRVSIHYIVGRDGTIAKGIAENQIAIHARRHNKFSIGIEMINEGDGKTPFPDVQMAALVKLVDSIRNRYGITLDNIHRHSDVDHSTFKCGGKSVARKQDPGPAFDWSRFQFELLLAGS